MKKIHCISLPKKEQILLQALIKSGNVKAQVLRRAQILLKANQKLKDPEIALHLGCHDRTVAEVRQRYSTGGLERALYDVKRPGRPCVIEDKDKAKVVALACTEPPEGYSRWTLNLLAEHCGVPLGRTKVWTILKENELKPWRKKNVVHSKAHS